MKTVLIASTTESTGKTGVAIALAELAQARDASVGYMKPKGTRLQSNVGKTLDTDPMLARDLLGLESEMHEMEPIVYSPTFVEGAIRGRENPEELTERVREAFDTISADRDFVAVEGADEISTGEIIDLAEDDVADLLDAEVVLLTRYEEPHDVDEILTAADRLDDRLTGVIFNAVPDAVYDKVETDVASCLEARGVPVLGVIPRDTDLAGVTVDDLAGELGATLVNDVPTDDYIERFLVGAMSGETALSHFRRTKDAAVITGGDRADVQTAALEAPGVKCLILTGGHSPPSAVVGSAEEKGIPILTVQSDTLTTVERAEQVVGRGRVRDARTVDRLRDLLYEHVDVDAVLPEDGRES